MGTYFGSGHVTRGDKALDVHANTYRIDADVVPTFEHWRYTLGSEGIYYIDYGVAFNTDTGKHIINWPEQTYENGVKKNSLTNRKYKRTIRIIKRLRNEMQKAEIAEATDISSFMIECLVWNVPNECFYKESYTEILRSLIISLYNNTKSEDVCKEWKEVNELKYLFRPTTGCSREQVNRFVQALWTYLGFK